MGDKGNKVQEEKKSKLSRLCGDGVIVNEHLIAGIAGSYNFSGIFILETISSLICVTLCPIKEGNIFRMAFYILTLGLIIRLLSTAL